MSERPKDADSLAQQERELVSKALGILDEDTTPQDEAWKYAFPFQKALEENRVGLIPMQRSVMQAHPDLVAEIQARCLIWDTESKFYADRIDMICYSMDFEPKDKGSMMPIYEVIITESRNHETGELNELSWRFEEKGYERVTEVEGAPV